MGAQLFIDPVVIALGEQITILIAKNREVEGIGIFENPGLTPLGCAQPVTRCFCFQWPSDQRFTKTTAVNPLQRI